VIRLCLEAGSESSSCSGAESRLAISFDHLIGAGEQRRRDDEAKRLGSLKVDDQLELGRLHDGQVDRLNAGEVRFVPQNRP
jgi:hypothetical protein